MKYLIGLSHAAILAGMRMPVAFDPGKPGWKIDENGHVVLKDGNPVYLDSNGNEMTVGADTISQRNAEAKANRERAEAAESKLKAYEGLDPEKARKALDDISKIDQKKLIDAGEVDKVRNEILAQSKEQLDALKAENEKLQGKTNDMIRTNALRNSKFIQERIAVPFEMFAKSFGDHFKVEGDKVVPYGADGRPMNSKRRIGENADIDEAVEILVENSPWKEQILKAPDESGSGNNGNGGGRSGVRRINRSDFAKLSPAEQASTAAKANAGEVAIVD